MLKITNALIFISTILVSGCATTTLQSTPQEATAIEQRFLAGTLQLEKSFSKAGDWGSSRHTAKKFHQEKRWKDLYTLVGKNGYHDDLAYYYLGQAAEGIGQLDLALVYYRATKKAVACKGFIDNCDGFDVPRLTKYGVTRVLEKQALMAADKLDCDQAQDLRIKLEQQRFTSGVDIAQCLHKKYEPIWVQHATKDTPAAYKEFLQQHPKAPQAGLARTAYLKKTESALNESFNRSDCPEIKRILDERKQLGLEANFDQQIECEWRIAAKLDTEHSYSKFVANNPNTQQTEKALERLDAITTSGIKAALEAIDCPKADSLNTTRIKAGLESRYTPNQCEAASILTEQDPLIMYVRAATMEGDSDNEAAQIYEAIISRFKNHRIAAKAAVELERLRTGKEDSALFYEYMTSPQSTKDAITCKVHDPDISEWYVGGCKNGLAHGMGHARGHHLTKPHEYIGEFMNGHIHGVGVYTRFPSRADYRYREAGRFNMGDFQTSDISFLDGTRYKGGFNENKKFDGYGVYKKPQSLCTETSPCIGNLIGGYHVARGLFEDQKFVLPCNSKENCQEKWKQKLVDDKNAEVEEANRRAARELSEYMDREYARQEQQRAQRRAEEAQQQAARAQEKAAESARQTCRSARQACISSCGKKDYSCQSGCGYCN